MSNNLSKYGTILKRETLATIKLSVDIPCLILNSNDPFPGYYCSIDYPADNSCKENSYYIPVNENEKFGDEDFSRLSLEIKSKLSVNICPAWFNLEEKNIRAFRIKEIEEKDLMKVVLLLEEKNITLYKSKKVKSFLSYIHLKEFFEIRQIEDSLFENIESEGLYYFTIPEQIEWEDFEKTITYQKSNSKFKNFDAAIGFWIEKPIFKDFIRIYGINLELKQLKGIQKDYLRNMRKYKKQGMLI